MKGENVKLFKPFDMLICLLIAVAAIIIPITFAEKNSAELFTVSANGAETTYSLNTDVSFTVESEGHTLTVCCKNGQVFVQNSDCADQICVGSGAISKPSEIIVCAPARVSVKITGEGEYDGTVK